MAPEVPSGGWVRATWTTGYWDCCKPTCAWPGKGSVSRPAAACDAATGAVLEDPSAESVCRGGTAANCPSYSPFVVQPRLSMGFAAAAVSGNNGLNGDGNCGQCFELKFIDRAHMPSSWGGSSQDLVGKSMVIQVVSIFYEVTGAHSFDLQIPGAGRGAFRAGCAAQFPGAAAESFDCGSCYGGCPSKANCSALPQALQPGCEWRYDWYSCLQQLTAISGSIPSDDAEYPAIDPADYA